MAHAFSEKALKSYEDDILGDLCFGQSFGMLEREENRFVVKVMVDSARLAMIVSSLLLKVPP